MDPMTDDAPQAAPPDSGSDGQDAAHELPEAPSLPDASVPDSPEEQAREQALRAGLVEYDLAEEDLALLEGRAVEGGGQGCLLYTSDAADDLLCVDLGGRR